MHYAVTGTAGRSSARVIAIEEPTGASCLEHEDHPGRQTAAPAKLKTPAGGMPGFPNTTTNMGDLGRLRKTI